MNAAESYKKYRSFFGTLIYMFIGCFIATYAYFIAPRFLMTADLVSFQKIFTDENYEFKQQEELALIADKADSEQEIGIRDLPAFLLHINHIAQATEVIIRELLPVKVGGVRSGNELKFKISITTDYFTFLRFAARLESLNVEINNLQVRPFDPTKTPAIHAISFSITPREDGKPLENARIIAIRKQVAAKNKRNPFQRFAYNTKDPIPTPWIDLTWIYRLSGIGRIGGERIATVDSRDYVAGDTLKDMTVAEVRSDQVMLKKQTENGEQIYVLGFRKKPTTRPKS